MQFIYVIMYIQVVYILRLAISDKLTDICAGTILLVFILRSLK